MVLENYLSCKRIKLEREWTTIIKHSIPCSTQTHLRDPHIGVPEGKHIKMSRRGRMGSRTEIGATDVVQSSLKLPSWCSSDKGVRLWPSNCSLEHRRVRSNISAWADSVQCNWTRFRGGDAAQQCNSHGFSSRHN